MLNGDEFLMGKRSLEEYLPVPPGRETGICSEFAYFPNKVIYPNSSNMKELDEIGGVWLNEKKKMETAWGLSRFFDIF